MIDGGNSAICWGKVIFFKHCASTVLHVFIMHILHVWMQTPSQVIFSSCYRTCSMSQSSRKNIYVDLHKMSAWWRSVLLYGPHIKLPDFTFVHSLPENFPLSGLYIWLSRDWEMWVQLNHTQLFLPVPPQEGRSSGAVQMRTCGSCHLSSALQCFSPACNEHKPQHLKRPYCIWME